ncbi:GAF domain-containing SpoIIE family protein phosphatase [Cryptosporangium arvum]|uniref:GAF domain-containing SpoIIE family protein phosphatase n=1 Tax=Cryptosporangium arvum TaxID=80871 RepID=UPI0004B58195|nr:GAF domain-containing SpoIIE family protein phosphatase [Cryptosporangium arvum]
MVELADEVFSAVRLAAVRRSELIGTGTEASFDRLAGLAARLLRTPFAFVTIVDDQRSFWKSCIGVNATDPGERQNPVGESFCQYVVNSGEPLIVGDVTRDPVTAGNPSIEKMGVRAWAGFPVHSPDGQILGTFCVVDTVPRVWTDDDVQVLETLSRSVSGEIALRAALAEARTAAADSALLAETLQLSLLPPALPVAPGLDLAAAYHPGGRGSEVLGDFYDVVPSRRGSWSVFVGDVCGKGPEAAKTTALARYTLRAAALQHASPAQVLGLLNPALRDWFGTNYGRFVTLAYTTIRATPRGCTARIATAGHEPVALRRRDGTVELIHTRGPVLGVIPALTLTERRVQLRPGESLILYTDGVTEARAPRSTEQFGPERLQKTLAGAEVSDTAADLATRLMDAVLDFGGTITSDDVAILVVRVPPAGPPSVPPTSVQAVMSP